VCFQWVEKNGLRYFVVKRSIQLSYGRIGLGPSVNCAACSKFVAHSRQRINQQTTEVPDSNHPYRETLINRMVNGAFEWQRSLQHRVHGPIKRHKAVVVGDTEAHGFVDGRSNEGLAGKGTLGFKRLEDLLSFEVSFVDI
jgi:hypothetical protein